jgi:hypothetical protein
VGHAAAGLALAMAVAFPTSHVWAHPLGVSDSARRAQAPTETPIPATPVPETPTTDPLTGVTATPMASDTATVEPLVPSDTPTADPTATSTATSTSPPPATSTSAPPVVAPLGIGDPIESLTGTEATPPSYCIEINSTLRAYEDINNSNLFYALILPGSPGWWQTTRYSVPSVTIGQAWSPPTWSVCNPPSAGTYTIFACWSPGNRSTNCSIDFAYTTFYSVPTLGLPLSLTGLGLLAVLLWRRRSEFARGAR